jgi:tRNA A37 threonylcarbamoyladenosine dehydratase
MHRRFFETQNPQGMETALLQTAQTLNAQPDKERFGGIERLYGRGSLERLARAHVAVIGVGGVGSWAVEALARSGVGALTLVDLDDVCVTNVNRQLPALDGEIGKPKVEVLAGRIARINPACRVERVLDFLTPANAESLLAGPFDFVIDATDRMSIKAVILATCRVRSLRALTIGGAGGRRDPAQVRCDDLGSATRDELLRQVRKKLRNDYGWPKGAQQFYGVPTVYSLEAQVFPWSNGEVCATPEAGGNLRMDCASGFGAAAFVTGTFGFVAAAEVVRQIVEAK